MGLRDQARVAAAWLAREGAWRPRRQDEESRSDLEQDAGMAARLREQVNLTAYSANPTQEDYYWGRSAAGAEEDYYWRRLSDNWYQKGVIPPNYRDIHNQCYEAYNS